MLSTDQGKKFIYVIVDKADPHTGKVGPIAERRYIHAGGLHGGLREILDKDGEVPLPANQKLGANERVVVSGLQRIQPGIHVNPRMCRCPRRIQCLLAAGAINPACSEYLACGLEGIHCFRVSSSIGRSSPSVLSIIITLIGGMSLLSLPLAQYPRHHAADRQGHLQLSRRQRPGGGRHAWRRPSSSRSTASRA